MTTKPRQPRRKPVAKRDTPAPVADPPKGSKTVDGRPACYLVETCGLPEFMDGVGLCGGHWANRPDLRKVARHD